MKLDKLLTFTLFNSFALLGAAGIFTSCEKNTIQNKGFLTSYSKEAKRDIASVGWATVKKEKTTEKRFQDFQDAKQIYVYCKLNSSVVNQCYKEHLGKMLTKYTQKFGPFKPSEIELIKNNNSFENIHASMSKINQNLQSDLDKKVNKIVIKRKEFCSKNSKKFLKKCLEQYLERDTFAVLNNFQLKQKGMNGFEYLYVKDIIQADFKVKLKQVRTEIEHERTKI